VKNTEQGKEIEKQLYSLLPNSLNIELLKIDNDLSLIVCSAAAEDIFQQSNLILIVFIYIQIFINIQVKWTMRLFLNQRKLKVSHLVLISTKENDLISIHRSYTRTFF
jgi:hypothetical protein